MELHKLLDDISKNDEHAFNELFLNYYEKLVQFAVLLLKNVELAEDAVADVFSNIWAKRGKLSGIGNVEAYLYTSVKNACLDQLKKGQKLTGSVNTATGILQSSNPQIEARELELLLANAINALPEQRRMVFVLVKNHGKKCSEVAEILGISIRTVESQLYKAVKTLANELTHYLGYNPQKPAGKQNGLFFFF